MVKEIIIKKIKDFIDTKDFKEECDVVYLFVELRKLLDIRKGKGQNKENYNILRFYSDWIVHTSKDRNIDSIEKILNNIIERILLQEKSPNNPNLKSNHRLDDLIEGRKLKESIQNLLNDEGIIVSLDKGKWQNLLKNMIQVLVRQPINISKNEVSKIEFLPSSKNGAIIQITRNQEINGKKSEFKKEFGFIISDSYNL